MFDLKLQTGADNPILRMKASEVIEFNDSLVILVEGMLKIMNKDGIGIGIAAPQVGILKRLFLITLYEKDDDKEGDVIICVNPEILEFSNEKNIMKEGCLSLPDLWIDIERPQFVKVKYFDIKNREVVVELSGINAREFQHEYDHLGGILMVDRMGN